jgi:hypothetical protein
MVMAGWRVLYRKEYDRLSKDPESAKMTAEERSAKAVEYADNIVDETQPNCRAENIAPMFKGGGTFQKAYFQFQHALSVIWQQTRYDLPAKIRRRQYGQAAGQVAGYAAAGILLGIAKEGFDDDDDEKKTAGKIGKWALSQFTDSAPFVGGLLADAVETMLAGKAPYGFASETFPALGTAGDALNMMIRAGQEEDAERFKKALWLAARSAGYLTGLPAIGLQDAGKLAGIGDGDGNLSLEPQTLLGRKLEKKKK